MVGQHRSTQRKVSVVREDEESLTKAIIRLATQYGRYGYRRITALLRAEGWRVNAWVKQAVLLYFRTLDGDPYDYFPSWVHKR